MLDYFTTYYLEAGFGPGYIVTNIVFILALVLLLNPVSWTPKGLVRKGVEAFLWWVGSILFCSVYYLLFGHGWMDRIMMVLFLALYALLRSKYKPITRIVRCCVYFSCTMLTLPISEPLGTIFEAINEDYTWAEHFTWVVVVVMTFVVLALLHRFSTEGLTFVPVFPAVFVVAVSALGLLQQWAKNAFAVDKGYNILVAASFWVLVILSYYMFYIVSQEYDRNLELLSVQHKMALDADLLHFSRENYEEMHVIRHELKNHLSYLRVLADAKEYDKLDAYLTTVSGETEKLFQFVECGNSVINGVMNYAIKTAHAQRVEIQSQIIVPPQLPYKEPELCSLLSNLMDNAIEAAARSGQDHPVVTVSIRPQRDYLFIRVTNPFDESLPATTRLSLRTTKQDRQTHGYGTKIIRNIAERNQGSVKFSIQDGTFVVDVMLNLTEGENNG